MPPRRLSIATCLTWLLFCSGRAVAQELDIWHGTYPARDSLKLDLSQEGPDAVACLQDLTWQPATFDVTVTSADEQDVDCWIRFPSPKPRGEPSVDLVCCQWYPAADWLPDSNQTRPAVLVVHESGSNMPVGKAFAQQLSRQGVHAFLIQLPGYGQRKSNTGALADDLIQVFMQGIADVRRGRDAVAALPFVSDSISLQGTSLGGFVACLSASLDDGFASVHLCLCGGDLYGVLTTGNRDAEKTLHKLLASGITREELRSKLQPIEPLRIAHRLDPAKTWLYTATFDQVVSARYSNQLADVIPLDPSHHIKLLSGHYSGIIYLPGICERIARIVVR